ncbi:MAG TPA: class A beta-lactamase-related serine hydrolase [Sphingobacterium sp.]|nr:class A beta-lactamase-related serine hydrolase [Sphingobacterium sp.]
MNRYFIFMVFILLQTTTSYGQKNDRKLEQKILEEIKGFGGDIGVYVQHLKTNKTVAIHADTVFPTASVVKVPILVGIFHKIAQGEYTLSQKFAYDAKRAYGGSGLMQHYKDSAQTDLVTMIGLMLTYSDNVTSIWLQELAGGGTTINKIMDEMGLQKTRVNSRTEGRQEIWEKYGWGQTTPKEIAQLFIAIRAGNVIDTRHSDKMYRFLKNQFYDGRSLSQIPATINTVSKGGSVNRARCEVVLVNAPSGHYVFSVMTKNNKDESWTSTNEAEELTRKISNIIWNHFEPRHPFQAYERIE